MENWKIEDICVDTLWNVIYSISSFFNKKVNLMAYIYGEVVDKLEEKRRTSTLSTLAKKKLFENNVVKYFSAIRDASVKAIKANDASSQIDVEGDMLNERGFARLSIVSNINTKIVYSPKTNKNIFLALGNALSSFTLNRTEFEGKGLFEIIYKHLQKHPTLYSSTPKAIANSFVINIENKDIIDNLIASYQEYLRAQIKQFQKDMIHQSADELSYKVADDVLSEVDKEYNMNSTNFSSVISLNLPRRILLLYGIDPDEDKGGKKKYKSTI